MDLYRVVNWLPSAASAAENGHPLFVWPRQGAGRLDDPRGEYLVLYAGSDPAGAVAESFGRFPRWTSAILQPPPGAPAGARKALVHYVGDPAILDLDDPGVLVDLGLRPSHVVDRDRVATQQWARRIYERRRFDGVSWWSYYSPKWASYGLWDWSKLRVATPPTPLELDDPAVVEAAGTIVRTIVR